MRHLAIGDVHGYSRVLDDLLEMVRPEPDDVLITLGDYVDRGPDSKGVIERLLELRRRAQLIALRGNHDSMMLSARRGADYLDDWLMCGGRATLDSYAADGIHGDLSHVPQAHWDFLEHGCIDWYEIDTHFFVHANAYPEVELCEQPLHVLHWEPLWESECRAHSSGKVMICGHTKQRSGRPMNLGHTVCIDTWVYGDGWLTCLDVASGNYWQANRDGQRRTGRLDED